MIHVQSITIEDFRGIRELTLDLKDKNFAVCGPNGTGKSGVVDALEFALTGNISRLSGRGTGDVSVKQHAPHVDSRDRPDKARVVLTCSIPHLNKTVTIDRNVQNAANPTISPSTPAVLDVLNKFSRHPEFVLSRRELIRYVISTPGDRSEEIQALLQLKDVEALRRSLNKVANKCERAVRPLETARKQAAEQLLRALEITELKKATILEAVNKRRSLLGLPPIETLEANTSLKDGLATTAATAQKYAVPKAQALKDIKALKSALDAVSSQDTNALCETATERLNAFSADPAATDSVEREALLQSAIKLITEDACPVCDTSWGIQDLKDHIEIKLNRFKEITEERGQIEKKLEPLVDLLSDLQSTIAIVEKYCAQTKPAIDAGPLSTLKGDCAERAKQLSTFLPIQKTVTALDNFAKKPPDVDKVIEKLQKAVAAIPEPSEQDAAREYLTISQERLENIRAASLSLKAAQERADTTKKIYDAYTETSTSVLNGIYKSVEGEFSKLYSFINREDEGNFTAHLKPSIGKLGFDVDFYNRGHFPPGAYHSEGHQDSMGVCLYLALMKYLLGSSFTFAVLDDVLMSIDAGHRREVCTLLKSEFPDTQFVLTTHDDIWLRHMKTAGLIDAGASTDFSNWDVDHGPTEWQNRDIWREIDAALDNNNVGGAAGLLRNYLEYISKEICHRLRARVEFRGDALFQLGDLLPSATGALIELLKRGEAVAKSWNKAQEADELKKLRDAFGAAVSKTQSDKWQVNAAIHYNEWAAFHKNDFAPVAAAFKELIEQFQCQKCDAFLYVLPERGSRESLRCECLETNINLKKKS